MAALPPFARASRTTMDITAIPRINSVILTGLDFSMKPDAARYEADKGFIKSFPEIKVMHQIKSLAIMVYNQEKMTPYYHGNVCDGRNSLAYFICAVHRQQAPQPKTHTRTSSNSSNSSTSSSGSCTSTRRSKNCELPKLVTTSMLPLGYWDSLYYAVVAEIRQLHSDLQNRYGFACENGTEPLHFSGPDGTTNQPITAINLASMLEEAWYTLMDNRLVATLDDAVRMRKMREQTATQQTGATKITENDRPPVVYGLMDVNALSPEAIIGLLWEKHAPEIDRACCENFEDESMLTAYRAELHAKQVEEGLSISTPMPSASTCSCHRACVCRLKCDKDADECTCKNRVHIYHQIYEQENTKTEVHTKYVKQDQNVPNQFLGAATNTLAQMQVAAMADPSPTIIQACYNVNEATNAHERQIVSNNRKRSDTNNSDLAYVPDLKTPYRGPKDAYPLGFYGRDSGQRYPTLHPRHSNASADYPSNFYNASSYGTHVPTRKPVPSPIATPSNRYPLERSQTQPAADRYGALTPPSSSPYNVQTFYQAGQVTYPAVPVSQSQSMFTQSFPAPTSGNPRETDENARTSMAKQPTYYDPARDYIGLLARHPSATNYPEQATETFPTLSQSVTTSPPKKVTTSKTTNALPTLKTLQAQNSLNKPQPPLPEPDFIAPRPAIKQRYVSAGGTAKLHERSEIPGPAFTTISTSQTSGAPISKEEVDAKMSDPEWVRRNFGESALGVTGTISPPRKSGDSSKRNSDRISDESTRGQSIDKRDRTSSGASGRVAKLKRVFSRKNSQSEALEEEQSE